MQELLSFFRDNFPPPGVVFTWGPVFIATSYSFLAFAGYLKRYHGLATGYSRKTFHFLTFATAVFIQLMYGLPILCLYAGMSSLVVLYAIIRGEGHLLYEAMAREKDPPHRTYYIVIPYFATAFGGIAANIFFGQLAIVGYLVCGVGDAIGEPVGIRYGKHKYTVPSLAKVKTTRSFEGSFAVFLVSLVAIMVGLGQLPSISLTSSVLLAVLATAIASAIAEGISPHGWDNATMQLVPPCLLHYLLIF